MIVSLKVGEAEVGKEGTVVMITEMVGGEGAGAEVMREGAVVRGGAGWNIMVKGGMTEARQRVVNIQRSVMYPH